MSFILSSKRTEVPLLAVVYILDCMVQYRCLVFARESLTCISLPHFGDVAVELGGTANALQERCLENELMSEVCQWSNVFH